MLRLCQIGDGTQKLLINQNDNAKPTSRNHVRVLSEDAHIPTVCDKIFSPCETFVYRHR